MSVESVSNPVANSFVTRVLATAGMAEVCYHKICLPLLSLEIFRPH